MAFAEYFVAAGGALNRNLFQQKMNCSTIGKKFDN